MKKGLVMVFTGDGKGKTTAALGLTLRAAGHGMKVCFIQFIKGSCKYGEMESVKRFENSIDFHVMGNGFTWKSDDLEKDIQIAKKAWEFARKAMASGRYHTIVLDEFTYLLQYHMVDLESCLEAFTEKDENLHLVITGRYAPAKLMNVADLVTEMRAVKHPYESGIIAQKGVEF